MADLMLQIRYQAISVSSDVALLAEPEPRVIRSSHIVMHLIKIIGTIFLYGMITYNILKLVSDEVVIVVIIS